MSTTTLAAADLACDVDGRLLVTQRGEIDRLYRAIGFLSYDGAAYRFDYLRSAITQPWFRPLPGLSRIETPYLSPDLFALFRERVLSSRRQDFESTMRALGLPQDAEPFEVLSRTGGHRAGDTIELIPIPRPDNDGFVSFTFFAHGVRHMSERAQERIAELEPGFLLDLRAETANPVNPRALLVTDHGDLCLGYVPDPLVDLVHEVISTGHALTVERANGTDVPYHFRLLVRLTGRVHGLQTPFTGPDWATATSTVEGERGAR